MSSRQYEARVAVDQRGSNKPVLRIVDSIPACSANLRRVHIIEWGLEVERMTADIEEKEMRWLELAELLEG